MSLARILSRTLPGISASLVQMELAIGRNIADRANSELIEPPHLAEAMQLRRSLPGS